MTSSHEETKSAQLLLEQGVVVRNGKSGSVLSLDFRNAKTSTSFSWSSLTRFPKLRELFLDECDFGDDDIRHVCELTKLQTLSLRHTNLSEVGAEQLSALSKLTLMQFSVGQLTDEFLAQFRKRMIATRIVVQ